MKRREIRRMKRRRQILLKKKRRGSQIRVLLAVFSLLLIPLLLYYGAQARRTKEKPKSTSQTEVKKSPPIKQKKEVEKEPQIKAKPLSKLRVAAVGDVLLARRVGSMIEAAGADAPFTDVASILKKVDLAIANLETSLSNKGSPKIGKDVTFRGSPEFIVGLKNSGIDVVSQANNHALDYGPEALEETISLLDKYNIYHAGAGLDEIETYKPAIFEVGEVKVAFLSFSHIIPAGFFASKNKAGIASCRDVAEVAERIRSHQSKVDYIITAFHWGKEYADYPLDYQEEIAHAAIDSGSDLVIGHHPHVIQGIEIYKERAILYSLGDFVFDHYGRKTGETFIFEADLNKGNEEGQNGKTTNIKLTPIYITSQGKPQVVKGAEANSILSRLEGISQKWNTPIKIDQDIGWIE